MLIPLEFISGIQKRKGGAGVIISVNGTVISGTTAIYSDYIKRLGKAISDGLQRQFGDSDPIVPPTPEELDAQPLRPDGQLLLVDARIVHPDGSVMPPFDKPGLLFAVRVDRIDAACLGQLSPSES